MTVFPAELPPHWIDSWRPPIIPQIETDFPAGGTARLRLTAIETDATFKAYWYGLTECSLESLWAFIRQVQEFEAFELTEDFFTHGNGEAYQARILGSSITGMWRLSDIPTDERLSNTRTSITLSFRSILE